MIRPVVDMVCDDGRHKIIREALLAAVRPQPSRHPTSQCSPHQEVEEGGLARGVGETESGW